MTYHALILWRDPAERCIQINAPDALTLRAHIERARQTHGTKDGFDVAAWQDTPNGPRHLPAREHAGPKMRDLKAIAADQEHQ